MLNLDDILTPNSPEAPAGQNLRYSRLYHTISEAVREDEHAGALGVWSGHGKRADWDGVIALAVRALSTQTKDLQIACWLAEALYHSKGLAGLAEGLGLITALCEQFWDCLHPEVAANDLAARLAPLWAMEERLVRNLVQLPLTEPDQGSGVRYTWQHWIGAERQIMFQLPYDNGSSAVSLRRIHDAAERTPVLFYQTLFKLQQLCVIAVSELECLLAFSASPTCPRLSSLSAVLASIGRLVGVFAGERKPQELGPNAVGTISSRNQAYKILELASHYLLSTEPPIQY